MDESRSKLQALVSTKNLYLENTAELMPRLEECLDLQYMTDKPGTTVGLYACAGLANAGAGDKGINWPQVNATTAASA
jgi:hypothetical protein